MKDYSNNSNLFFGIKCQSNLINHSSTFYICKNSGLICCSKCSLILKISKHNLIELTEKIIPFLRTATYVNDFIKDFNFNIGLCSALTNYIINQKENRFLLNEIESMNISEEGIKLFLDNPKYFEDIYNEIQKNNNNKNNNKEVSIDDLIDLALPLNEDIKENYQNKIKQTFKKQKVNDKIIENKNNNNDINSITSSPIYLSSDKNSSSEVEILNPKDYENEKTPSIKEQNNKDTDLLMAITNDSNLIIYNPYKNITSSIKIIQEFFDFTFYYNIIYFPFEKSKQITINDSLYITGGIFLSNEQKNVYKIKYNNGKIKISKLPDMNFSHSLHNITFFPEKNYLIICGGVTSKNCEFLDISQENTNWENFDKLNELRANATLFTINNRFIYCIGGYDFKNKRYSNGYELYDMEKTKVWKLFQLKDEKFMISTMGVIKYNNYDGKILLLGGFANFNKRNDALKQQMEVNINNDGEFISVIKGKIELTHRCLFYNRQDFIHVGNGIYKNFTKKFNIASYNINNNSFSITNQIINLNTDDF